MFSKSYLNIALLVLASSVNANDDGPEITIKEGTLRGEYRETKYGKTISAFTAIPYAKPAVGKLRFRPAVAPEPWKGILDATRPHPVCPQPTGDSDAVIGKEDCLYLNVYTPQFPDSNEELLPVIFHIHGGGFVSGNANMFVPDLLVTKGVVVVTANYRLGPLGFFTTGTLHALGNEGLKDQVFALKWAKENIAKFGGDPKYIIVAGHSAGGVSAHYHMLSPLSKNLINGVIAQSGTALAQWGLMPHFLNARRGKIVAGQIGCNTYDVEEMMQCLLEVDASEIIKKMRILYEWNSQLMFLFKPVIEPPMPDAFLSEDPIEVITSGKAADVPLLTGLAADEGAVRADLFKNPNILKDLDTNFSDIAAALLMYGDGVAYKHRETIAPAVREFYFGDKPIDESTTSEFIKMFGDATVLTSEDVAVGLHSKYSKKPIYYYLFGYRGSSSYSTLLSRSSENFGVSHGDELLYLFNSEEQIPGHKLTETDEKMADLMTTLWANFAKYGNPTPDAKSPSLTKWEPVEKQKRNYYYIRSHDDVEMAEGLYEDRAEFWRNLQMNVRTKRIRDEL